MSSVSPHLLCWTAVREFKIPQSSAAGNMGYADLVVPLTGEIYEIKSLPQRDAGKIEVERYVEKANINCTGSGIIWKKGTSYFPTTITLPDLRDPTKELTVTLDQPGLIIYRSVPKNNTVLQPVPIPQNIHEKIKKFLERIGQNTQNFEKEIIVFLNQNPDVKTFLKAAAVGAAAGIIVGTIIEDVITLGAGVADDFASFALAYRLVRVAQLL